MIAVSRDWALFLDRDGVINRRVPGDYVRRWEDFEFLPGALEGLAALAPRFGPIVVVTNQRGVGRGLMSEADVANVHQRMLEAVRAAGGRIDRVYTCPHTEGCDCRKPLIGLARQAQRDFPAIDPSRAIMAGDSSSDFEFARNAGLHWVHIHSEPDREAPPSEHRFPDLLAFSRAL